LLLSVERIAMTRLEKLHELAAWLDAQPGTQVAHDLELADFGEPCGFGFRATAPISAGTVLVSVPVELTFSAAAARVSPTLGPLLERVSGLRDDDLLAALLLHEKGVDAAPRKAHIAALPDVYDATLFWSDSELAELRGSPLHTLTLSLQEQTAADFAALQALFCAAPELFPRCSLADYRWALATLWSRAMDLPPPANKRLIAPWCDMFNNDPALPVCHAFETSQDVVVVLAGRDYSAGEAVCINYGLTDAASSLRLHGFIAEGAPVEVPLWAEMSVDADLYAAKRRLLDAAGVPAGAPFLLTAQQPIPPLLLPALRAQRLTATEAASVEAGQFSLSARVSEPNERAALTALLAGVKAMVEAYPTTSAEDERLLASAELSSRVQDAVTLRLAEKRILHACESAVRLELARLDVLFDVAAAPLQASVLDGEARAPEAAAALARYFEELLAEERDSGAAATDGLDTID
jgi:[ribulose-bisphosphate carboxylase]-lysine N-methyltransferase